MKISVTTTSATSATQRPVMDRPMFSSLRLGMRCAMEEPFSSGQGDGGIPRARDAATREGRCRYAAEMVPSASFLTFMLPIGMKPSSTTVAAKSSDIMNSMKALVTGAVDSSSSSRVYMCS